MANTTQHDRSRQAHRRWTSTRLLPVAWLASSVTWAAVIVVTDHAAWPLAIWIATTIGPLTAAERRHHIAATDDGAPT